MSDKIILVTPPDDVLMDGFRLMLVDLNQSQSQLISYAFNKIANLPTTIAYVWTGEQDKSWLLDKKIKCDLIIFNADSDRDLIIGYMAAQKNSYYFGNLKDLGQANTRTIYDVVQLIDIMEKAIKNYEQT